MAGGAKKLDRAALIDASFAKLVSEHEPRAPASNLADLGVSPEAFLEVFDSQLLSRHLDLLARRLRVENRVFYTIGSAGHEGNALLGRLTRHTDPAFLHY
ncbi:MAG: MFS transporter, partial [Pseudomonadota bacterium]